MKPNSEGAYLLRRRLHEALAPVEIAGTAVASAVAFAGVYSCVGFEARQKKVGFSLLVLGSCVAAAAAASWVALRRFREGRRSRTPIALSILLWTALGSGVALANRTWWNITVHHYNWRAMATYTHVDPSVDKGLSYMDAGAVVFTPGSRVLRNRAIAFRNGHTYCVAPIVRDPAHGEATKSGPGHGLALPPSGTIDFWAVGMDCCGLSGKSFRCHEAAVPGARSGLRELDATASSMYALAAQEWSASSGLSASHPLFFRWVSNLRASGDAVELEAENLYHMQSLIFFFVSCILSFLFHVTMQKWRIA